MFGLAVFQMSACENDGARRMEGLPGYIPLEQRCEANMSNYLFPPLYKKVTVVA